VRHAAEPIRPHQTYCRYKTMPGVAATFVQELGGERLFHRHSSDIYSRGVGKGTSTDRQRIESPCGVTRDLLNVVLARRWTAAEADDVAVAILDVEVLRAPCVAASGFMIVAPLATHWFVKRFDALDAGRGLEMLVVAAPPAVSLVLRPLLQM
jgi:hypothetical protein